MRTLESYFLEYSESHKNSVNLAIHKICVPAITWSLLGALHTVHLTADLRLSHIFAFGALIYYSLFRKITFLVAMTVVTALIFWSFQFIENLLLVSVIVFVIAWIGQFYGHHVEGKKPSFLKDIQFLLIGPLWVINKFFPKSAQLPS